MRTKQDDNLLITFDTLRNSGNRPRLHGNGQIQLDFGNGRIHIWHPEATKLSQKNTDTIARTPIHDHRFSFRSAILLGKLGHFEYELHKVDAAEAPWIKKSLYDIYQALVREGEDTILMKVNNPDTVYSLVTVNEQRLSWGSCYSFGAYKLHETTALVPTMTYMVKTSEDKDYNPIVLCPVNKVPDNDFNRYQVNEETLWEIIHNTIFDKIITIHPNHFVNGGLL